MQKNIIKSKEKSYGNEDDFDLVMKNYSEFLNAFIKQNALPISIYKEAINNTNIMASSVKK